MIFTIFLLGYLFMLSSEPVGTITIPNKTTEHEQQPVRMEIPRFIIPRQIVLEGFPLPGGNFGFVPDPHYRYSWISEENIVFPDGSVGDILLRSFDVNYRFDRSIRTHYLALSRDKIVTSIEIENISLVPLSASISPKVAGVLREGAVVFFGAVEHEEGDQENGREPAIAVLEYPSLSKLVDFVVESDEESWNELVRKMKMSSETGIYADGFCESRWLPTYEFWTVELGRAC